MGDKVVLSSSDIDNIIRSHSEQICNDIDDMDKFAIVGIQTRGVELAKRIEAKISKLSGKSILSGTLDITFHRDDLSTRGALPVIKETKIEFDVTDMTILLVDDVIFKGRTAKAALETLMTFGRSKAIKLFALIDRGNRELPIQPDYRGHKIETDVKDNIKVLLYETDGVEDSVILYRDK